MTHHNDLYLTSFRELPAAGQAEFRVPRIQDSLQIDNLAIGGPSVLTPLVFTIDSLKGQKVITLELKSGEPLQIYDASPELPPDYESMDYLRTISPDGFDRWMELLKRHRVFGGLVETQAYPHAVRHALQRPLEKLVLVQSADQQFWKAEAPALLRNMHAAQKFLELAGIGAKSKLLAQAAIRPLW